jgi:hypothetical protein
MASTTLKKTPNDWLAVLSEAGKKVADIVPPGFKTVDQIAQETGKSVTMTRLYVREALKQKLVEETKLKVEAGGKLYPTFHYRIL